MAELDRSHKEAGVLAGVVRELDAAVGLGVIARADGTTHAFHVIEIADGTRHVDVGTEVTFDLLAKLGRYEAANIRAATAS
jgi:cold shock CspA family protein